jgi:hypothetical protein
LGDLAWKTGANHPLNLAAVLQDETNVGRLSLTFKAQKNGENGEQHLFMRNQRLFMRNDRFPAMCFVHLFLRITKCFLRFLGEDYSKPLCICRDALGKLRYVTASDVNFVFRLAAAQVYTLDPFADKALLDRFSTKVKAIF